ncbi:glutathione peroxidase [Alkalibacterium olivapovliticus]|uniref:Glutathione peroxidase n=1 Tax=Alkalibacterium olivapovliticus TaxID=99907 RepID=A0A2T0WAJ3_9LACT|nr:glutathione peroxidase [Alkalibacterium olivapovliticus]PRY83730.1 glutathione peroxidase [Alkalibacterium olivapovliticus]
MMTTVYDFKVKTPSEETFDLKEFEGHVLLIVNTASHCGFATQFEDLQALHDKYKDASFKVLGFPCGQFKNQEFDDIDQTVEFCRVNYNVSFPMFAKIDVNGETAHPLYKHLKAQSNGILSNNIKWNFSKFLVDSHGQVVNRYAPTTKPLDIEDDIKKLLKS